MRLRQNIYAWCGIICVLFVAMASVWGGPLRAQSTNQMLALYAAGFTTADICGTVTESHDHCPLCRLLDDVATPEPAYVVTDCLVRVSIRNWITPCLPAAIAPQAINPARAPPFMDKTTTA